MHRGRLAGYAGVAIAVAIAAAQCAPATGIVPHIVLAMHLQDGDTMHLQVFAAGGLTCGMRGAVTGTPAGSAVVDLTQTYHNVPLQFAFDVAAGDWMIAVEARDTSGQLVGNGCAAVTVAVGDTRDVPVTVYPPGNCGNSVLDPGEMCEGEPVGGCHPATCQTIPISLDTSAGSSQVRPASASRAGSGCGFGTPSGTGCFAVAFENGASGGVDVTARWLSSDGSRQYNAQVNATTAGSQLGVAAAAGSSFYAFVFKDFSVTPGVRVRTFTANGNPFAATDALMTSTVPADLPAVAVAGSTGMVVWTEGGASIVSRTFDSTGAATAVQAPVSGVAGNLDPTIAAVDPATFFVAWTENPAPGETDAGIRFRTYDATTSTFGTETAANTTTAGGQSSPAAAATTTSGSFLCVWLSPSGGALTEVRGRIFATDGTPQGPDFAVSSAPASLQNPVVAGGPDYWAVVWNDTAGTVYARIVDAAGTFRTIQGTGSDMEFPMTTSSLPVMGPAVAAGGALTGGATLVLVAWTVNGAAGDPDLMGRWLVVP